MYTQDDIEQFSLALVLGLYEKALLDIDEYCDLCIEDKLGVFEDNQLLIDFCNKNQYEIYMPFNGDKSRSGYFFDSMYQDKHFYKNVNTVYDINVLFDIGIPMIQLTEDDTELSQEVFDDVFSYSDTKELTPQQLEYIESLEWDCEYWDSLDVKLIDSLDPELRELCFEYYDSMLPEVLDPVEDMMITLSLQLSGAEMDALDEPVRDDVKLLPPVIEPLPVEVIVVPQEVVSKPQEELSLSTTTNEDKTMSILPDFSTNGNTFNLVPVEFTSIWYEVPTVDVVELTGQYTELTCDVMNGQSSDVLEGWVGKASHLTSHISDGWYGQCCPLTERLSTEEREAVINRVEAMANGKKAPVVKQFKSELRPNDEIETLARIQELSTPTTTTKSGKVVPVSHHAVTPHGNAPVANCITSTKVTSAIGEASAIDPVDEYKSTLFTLNDYDITRNIVVDVATTTPATPKAPATPKLSTAKFANNFNSLVMAKYRELSNGIIKDSLVLNKLTSALRANNVEAYTNLVTTFGNPTAVALHRQAYDAVVSAS